MRTGLIKQQGGATILEVLVSILILSLGILALVGLQARSISAVSDAKYRVEATNFADQIIGVMWADSRANLPNYPTLVAPAAAAWSAQVMATLPGAVAPAIAVVPQPAGAPTGYLVNVVVSWAPPGMPSGAPPHRVVVQTRIDNP